MTCLVVDDSKLARLSLIKSLNIHTQDAIIHQATNGLEAVELATEHKPDLIFLDLTMPVMDGYEALPLLLQESSNSLVVVVSADVQERAKAKVLSLGAKMHIQKPINELKMKEILEQL